MRESIGGRYSLRRRLGHGRLGDIFEAFDQTGSMPAAPDRVAVQLVPQFIAADKAAIDRLKRGYAALRASPHPNVVGLLELDRHDGLCYLVMELLEGASLRFVLDDTAGLPVDEVLPLITAAGDALEHLHGRSIVHGNVSPSSVLVTFDYTVKLVDIVPFANSAPAPSAGGAVDVRDDVYGLACLAYELLAGRHPFDPGSPDEGPPGNLRPARLEPLTNVQWQSLAAALELNPQRRTATIGEFLRSFAGAPAARPAPLSAPSTLGHTLQAPAAAPAPSPPPIRPTPPRDAIAADPRDRRDLLRPPHGAPTTSRAIVHGVLALTALATIVAIAWLYYDDLRVRAADVFEAVRTDDAPDSAQPATRSEPPPIAERAMAMPVAAAPPRPAPPVPRAVTAADADTTPETGEASAPAPPAAEPADAEPEVAAAEVQPEPAIPEVTRIAFQRTQFRAAENESAARIVVERSGNVDAPTDIVWWTADGTAIASDDFADLGVQVARFAPGETSYTLFVPLINDSRLEETEHFTVFAELESPAPGARGAAASARVEIADDD